MIDGKSEKRRQNAGKWKLAKECSADEREGEAKCTSPLQNGGRGKGLLIANYNSIPHQIPNGGCAKMSGSSSAHSFEAADRNSRNTNDHPSPPPSPPTSATTALAGNGQSLTDQTAIGRKRLISVEPAMFLFMCSVMIKFPVFQQLLYEKACLNSGRYNATLCADIRVVHKDVPLQREANHVLLLSSLCMFGPAIPLTLLLGALFDSWSSRRALLIPLIGLLLCDLNYVLQSLFMDASVYWLLLSDLVYSCAGGFSAIVGMFFAYSVKVTPACFSSVRISTMEGALGLGTMSGYLLSGQLRQAFGYAWVFALITLLHLIILIGTLLFLRELVTPQPPPLPKTPNQTVARAVGVERSRILREQQTEAETEREGDDAPPDDPNPPHSPANDADRINATDEINENAWWRLLGLMIRKRLGDIVRVYGAKRNAAVQRCLNIVLIAMGVNLFSAAGLMDVLFSYLRFQLQWTDREYGWFSGLNSGMNSLSVILLYPFLHKRLHIDNLQLVCAGLLAKIGHVLMLAFAASTLAAMLSLVPALLYRFPTTGMRVIASACVRHHEQGKVFALISLLDGLSTLSASLFFNGLYPYTLQLFAGTMLLFVALLLLIPLALLIFVHSTGLDKRIGRANNSNNDDDSADQNSSNIP